MAATLTSQFLPSLAKSADGHSWSRAAAISADGGARARHPPTRIPSCCSRPRACAGGGRTGPTRACVQHSAVARAVLRRCSASKAAARLASPGLDDIRGAEEREARTARRNGRSPSRRALGVKGVKGAFCAPREGLWCVQLDLEGAFSGELCPAFVPGRGFRTCGLRAPPSYGNTSSGDLAQVRKTSSFPHTNDQNGPVSPSNVDSYIRRVSASRSTIRADTRLSGPGRTLPTLRACMWLQASARRGAVGTHGPGSGRQLGPSSVEYTCRASMVNPGSNGNMCLNAWQRLFRQNYSTGGLRKGENPTIYEDIRDGPWTILESQQQYQKSSRAPNKQWLLTAA